MFTNFVRPKKTLKAPCKDSPGHYRRISLQVWLKLLDLYGIQGYAIAVRGCPYDDLKRWRIFKDPKIIDIGAFPELKIKPAEEEKVADNSISSKLTSAFAKVNLNLF